MKKSIIVLSFAVLGMLTFAACNNQNNQEADTMAEDTTLIESEVIDTIAPVVEEDTVVAVKETPAKKAVAKKAETPKSVKSATLNVTGKVDPEVAAKSGELKQGKGDNVESKTLNVKKDAESAFRKTRKK
jgi:hypothetical protein